MYRYKLILEYDGSKFFGFQKQNNVITVQKVLEQAVSKLSNAGNITVYCAGRTDTGVHATNQVIHFDLPRNLSNKQIKLAINYYLKPYAVSICTAENLGINSTFHARFSAKERYYEYKILEQDYKPTFNGHLYLWHPTKLDISAMNNAAQILVGKHDFTSFRSKSCASASAIKTINEIAVTKTNNIIIITVKAPSFLHHQVRFIVGALLKVGENKWIKNDLLKLLLAKDNNKNAALANPNGLYLTNVIY